MLTNGNDIQYILYIVFISCHLVYAFGELVSSRVHLKVAHNNLETCSLCVQCFGHSISKLKHIFVFDIHQEPSPPFLTTATYVQDTFLCTYTYKDKYDFQSWVIHIFEMLEMRASNCCQLEIVTNDLFIGCTCEFGQMCLIPIYTYYFLSVFVFSF